MRVMYVNGPGQTPALVEGEAPQPLPGPGEVLVRVHSVGVTPTELLWYPTSHEKSGSARTKAIPGHEFSGTVDGAGDVFGMNDWFASGAIAEYCTAPSSAVVPKPPHLTHAEAASVPIGALTAWQGLFDRAKLQAGERVLIHGGAGAVGMFAVQLAHLHRAEVLATASAHNLDFVRSLGAEQALDYRASRFEDSLREVDVVFDTVGGETLHRSKAVLKPGGRLITIAETESDNKEAFFLVEPNAEQLMKIGDLLSAGQLRTFVDGVVPFSRASDAFTGQVQRHGRGKLVIAITS